MAMFMKMTVKSNKSEMVELEEVYCAGNHLLHGI